MRATVIEGADAIPLGAPADWAPETHGHCGALFVRREIIDSLPFMRSAWEVDAREAMLLYAGARVLLGVQGATHPVVQMGIAELPPDFEPTVNAQRFTDPSGKPYVRVDMLFPHEGGRAAFCKVHVDGTLADAVSMGIINCESLARERGWLPAI